MAASTSLGRASDPLPRLQRRFTASLAGGDGEGASQVIDDLLKAQKSLLEIYLEIIAPALVSIGDSWCTGEIGVGDEHLATRLNKWIACGRCSSSLSCARLIACWSPTSRENSTLSALGCSLISVC
jgi:hypothetical protein